MKALVKTKHAQNSIELIEWDEPTLADNEVTIRVEWVGICGTDISIQRGTADYITPVVLGHELAGTVVEIGKNVTGISVGDKVTAETSVKTCGVCSNCVAGFYNVCKERLGMGRTAHGAFRERMNLDYKLVHKLPQGISTLEAALCEPAAVAYHAVVERGKVDPSDSVYIFGPGPIGILVAQVALVLGESVTIIGLPADQKKLKLCEDLGCKTMVWDPGEEPVVTEEVDVVFECSGSISAAQTGLRILRPRGRYVQVGLFNKDLCFAMNTVAAREINIMGCYSAVGKDFKNVLRLIEKGKLNLESLISQKFSLAEWERAFECASENASLKVLLHP